MTYLCTVNLSSSENTGFFQEGDICSEDVTCHRKGVHSENNLCMMSMASLVFYG